MYLPRTARRTTDRQPTIVCAPKDASCCHISRNSNSNHNTPTRVGHILILQRVLSRARRYTFATATAVFASLPYVKILDDNHRAEQFHPPTPKTRSYEAPSSSIMSTDAMAVPAPEGEPVGLHSPPDSNSAPQGSWQRSELWGTKPEPDTDELVGIQPEYIFPMVVFLSFALQWKSSQISSDT